MLFLKCGASCYFFMLSLPSCVFCTFISCIYIQMLRLDLSSTFRLRHPCQPCKWAHSCFHKQSVEQDGSVRNCLGAWLSEIYVNLKSNSSLTSVTASPCVWSMLVPSLPVSVALRSSLSLTHSFFCLRCNQRLLFYCKVNLDAFVIYLGRWGDKGNVCIWIQV